MPSSYSNRATGVATITVERDSLMKVVILRITGTTYGKEPNKTERNILPKRD